MDIVLGAGIVGVSTALHLQARGRDVVLFDRNGIGNETSHGNAGLIERTDLLPRTFPRNIFEILRYATNNDPRVRYNLVDMVALAPWLVRYWWNSNNKNVEQITKDISPLFIKCLEEHKTFTKKANAGELLHDDG